MAGKCSSSSTQDAGLGEVLLFYAGRRLWEPYSAQEVPDSRGYGIPASCTSPDQPQMRESTTKVRSPPKDLGVVESSPGTKNQFPVCPKLRVTLSGSHVALTSAQQVITLFKLRLVEAAFKPSSETWIKRLSIDHSVL